MLSYVQTKIEAPNSFSSLTKAASDHNLEEELLKFETQFIVRAYKFGVLLAKEGQRKENEVFSNGNIANPSILIFISRSITKI
jgi:hypothetical protein